jgi:hypothetical protein
LLGEVAPGFNCTRDRGKVGPRVDHDEHP